MTLNINSMIHLDMQVVNCDAEFLFNGIPIRRLTFSNEQFYTTVAHKYLVNGTNSLEITVMPGNTPSTSKEPYPKQDSDLSEASAIMRLVQYPVGATPGEIEQANVLAELTWQYNHVDEEKSNHWPRLLHSDVSLPKLFEPWQWQNAEAIDIETERANIITSIKTIHHLFESGDGNRMAQACHPYLLDIGKALPAYGETAFRTDIIESINSNRGKTNWVKPIDEAELDFRLCCNNTLVQVIDKNWMPSIRTLPSQSGETYPFRIFIGKLNGQYWVLA